MAVGAVVVAGGEGVRMGAGRNKVLLEVGGRSILERSLTLFQSHPLVAEMVLVSRRADMQACERLRERFSKLHHLVTGGDVRHRSEFAGIQALAGRIDAGEIDVVLVHDAVRPFASPTLINRLVAERGESIGCIPGLPLPATVVAVKDGYVVDAPRNLWAVQTPQAFEATWLLEAHNRAARQGFLGTDTASVIEWAGGDVRVIAGEARNIKITTPADLDRAERIASDLEGGRPAGRRRSP